MVVDMLVSSTTCIFDPKCFIEPIRGRTARLVQASIREYSYVERSLGVLVCFPLYTNTSELPR